MIKVTHLGTPTGKATVDLTDAVYFENNNVVFSSMGYKYSVPISKLIKIEEAD